LNLTGGSSGATTNITVQCPECRCEFYLPDAQNKQQKNPLPQHNKKDAENHVGYVDRPVRSPEMDSSGEGDSTPSTVSTGIDEEEEEDEAAAAMGTALSRRRNTPNLIPYDVHLTRWSVGEVVAWLKSFEALRTASIISSIVTNGVDGRVLMGDADEAASAIGINFGPHKRLFKGELEKLKKTFKGVDIPPLELEVEGDGVIGQSPSPSPSPRPHTDRAKQAVHRRKKSKSPVNRVGSFQSLDSVKDDLSVASGLEDSISVDDGKERMRNLSKKVRGGGKEARAGKARPFSKGAAKGVKQPPRLKLTLDFGGDGESRDAKLELDTVKVESGRGQHRKGGLERSYELSDGGTFYAGGFGIDSMGIKEVPVSGSADVILEDGEGDDAWGRDAVDRESELETVREDNTGATPINTTVLLRRNLSSMVGTPNAGRKSAGSQRSDSR